uniref:DNA-directed RNA polymerase n=1 Tax=Callorhinchus milii TaxID=7868 RepID=A0A4W3HZ33_CALMI
GRPWIVFRRNYSSSLLREDDWKKQNFHLLEVLEARLQQLQADNPTQVRHTVDVQFIDSVNVTCLESLTSSKSLASPPARAFKQPTCPPERGKLPERHGSEAEKVSAKATSVPSKWLEKLKKEKRNKVRKQQNLAKKIKKAPPQSGTKTLCKSAGAKVTFSAVKGKKGVASTETESISLPEDPQGSTLAEVERLNLDTNNWVSFAAQLLEDRESNKHWDAQRNILAYVEACSFIGDLDRAHHCVLFHHRHLNRRKHLNIKIYSVLMRLWAKKVSLNQIGRLFSLVEEAELKPKLDCYAAALECMGRMESCAFHVIRRCLHQLEEDGFTLQELLKGCLFHKDEREMVMKAIRVVEPDFQLPIEPAAEVCRSPLVMQLYSKEEPIAYPKLDLRVEELRQRFSRQLSLEQADTVTINSIEAAKPVTEKMKRSRRRLADLRSKWRKSLLQAFRDCKLLLAGDPRQSWKMNIYPYLCLLDDKEYVDIMLQSITNLPPNGEALLIMSKDLGNRVYNKYSVRKKIKNEMVAKMKDVYGAYVELLAKDTEVNDYLPREYWAKIEAEMNSGPSLRSGDTLWPHTLIIQLGSHLVDLMVRDIKIPINSSSGENRYIPVLYHMYTFRSNKQIGFIKPHPILTQILAEAAETTLSFDSYVMPMVCPPIPWISPSFGAYTLTPTKLMRCLDGAVQHQLLLEKSQSSDLHAVLDSLNQLGSCAWKINQPVLDLIVSIFNHKGSEELEIPRPLSEAPAKPQCNPSRELSAGQKTAFKREVAGVRKKLAEMHSLRMDALYKLSIANHMRDEVFWFPHNMDFRGRTYPCPPYFNHLGSDVTRALLLFADGKPLGEGGLTWLKIHLVNLTGLKKKSSLKARLAYANKMMDEILDSADNPLTGRKWWMNADEPWQALGCCMEIASAVRSPDPTQYISHFPVHQDGSCNGLQHYAALGRDVIGATSVNLVPCEVPQDVYSGVAQQVEEFRKRDAAKGDRIAQILEGFINRKVVKQTVMTVVYGVTRFGGRLQIEKRLKEMENFPKEHVWEASHFLVKQVFSSLKEMFTLTREIQDWLTESARQIAKSGHSVEWVTPLGLSIVQPYHRTKTMLLRSNMQYLNLQISHDVAQRPDTVKQKNAFAPNFIHSLDSTHMMLTALYCYRAGLTFVSVHDCFWTHAITVDVMNKICREQFVALHSQPILKDLSRFLVNKYLPYIPVLFFSLSGEFDLQEVKESTYFFS